MAEAGHGSQRYLRLTRIGNFEVLRHILEIFISFVLKRFPTLPLVPLVFVPRQPSHLFAKLRRRFADRFSKSLPLRTVTGEDRIHRPKGFSLIECLVDRMNLEYCVVEMFSLLLVFLAADARLGIRDRIEIVAQIFDTLAPLAADATIAAVAAAAVVRTHVLRSEVLSRLELSMVRVASVLVRSVAATTAEVTVQALSNSVVSRLKRF